MGSIDMSLPLFIFLILKSLSSLLQYCFCFVFWFWFFGQEGCGMLAPQPGIEPVPPALEGEVLTTGLPGSPRSGPINTRQSRFTIGEYYRDKEEDVYI